jgi:hypothetical protein
MTVSIQKKFLAARFYTIFFLAIFAASCDPTGRVLVPDESREGTIVRNKLYSDVSDIVIVKNDIRLKGHAILEGFTGGAYAAIFQLELLNNLPGAVFLSQEDIQISIDYEQPRQKCSDLQVITSDQVGPYRMLRKLPSSNVVILRPGIQESLRVLAGTCSLVQSPEKSIAITILIKLGSEKSEHVQFYLNFRV